VAVTEALRFCRWCFVPVVLLIEFRLRLPVILSVKASACGGRTLRHAPTKVSKSRIKKLRGLRRPQYRLRIDDIRVFYDVAEGTVQILAVIPKSKAAQWVEQAGDKI